MKHSFLVLCFALAPICNLWAFHFQVGDLYYQLINDSEAQLVHELCNSALNYKCLTTVVIPDSIAYEGRTYAVASIGERAFMGCSTLTSVTIPKTIKEIGLRAFDDCTSITSIVWNAQHCNDFLYFYNSLMDTIAYVAKHRNDYDYYDWRIKAVENQYRFDNDKVTSIVWPALEEITFGNHLYYSPFYHARANITSFVFGDGVEYIPATLCFEMKKLRQILLPKSLKKIGTLAFYNCKKLTSITIAGTVNSIANDVFFNCYGLSSVSFLPSSTNTVLNMGYQMNALANQVGPFSDASLQQVKLNRNINYTLYEEDELDDDNEALFSGSKNSFSVEMGNQVTIVPPYMFAYSGITSINIPVSVTAIQTNAFRDCKNLQTVVIEPSSEHIRISVQSKKDMGVWSTNGTFYQSPLRTIKLGRHIDYYSYDDETPLSPNYSSDGVFAKYSTPTDYTAEVEIGSNVDAIHNYMFYNVPMQSVTIPARVDAIGKGAFNCSTLHTVTCEGSVPPRLDTNAFNLTPLQNVYIPAGSWNSYVSVGTGWSTYQTKLRDPQRSQQ